MHPDSYHVRRAGEIMDRFAGGTGLDPEASPRRYLWTDAFAVCQFLGLHRLTGEPRHRDRALRLVDQVRHVLGRHRPDDARRGWISGLTEEEGERHPTAGGLRIGKPLPERSPGEPYDPRDEWDRDGQYYHYLTRWMLALHAVHAATGQECFHRWALELARAAHAGFVHAIAGRAVLCWKMSIDLSRPLVASTGAFDPVDGFAVLATLDEAEMGPTRNAPALSKELDALAAMCRGGRWATDDPLGLGGILTAACRLARLLARDRPLDPRRRREVRGLLEALLEQAVPSLAAFERSGALDRPAETRLPFRELGLAIGLLGIDRWAGGTVEEWIADVPAAAPLIPRLRRVDLAERIAAFWLEPSHRRRTWRDHADINGVMLATVLVPDGFLDLDGRDAGNDRADD